MSSEPIQLKHVHSFHVGGKIVKLESQEIEFVQVSPDAQPREVDLNGHYVTGQLYAQHFQLENPRFSRPVLFWHGGAMSGVTWETIPDGREGWTTQFLRKGYDVVVSDAVERGRSSWSPFPQIYKSAPLFRTQEDAWTLFRMGKKEGFHADPHRRVPYDPMRFPIGYFDQLCAQFVPRWTTNNQITIDAYVELLTKFKNPIIVAHSQGGWFAQKLASIVGKGVAAVVLVEPAGAPQLDEFSLRRASEVPHLYIWGDNCDNHPAWKPYKHDAVAHSELLNSLGGKAQHIDLPKMGILGNSHLPMMDDNCVEIANLFADWLKDIV